MAGGKYNKQERAKYRAARAAQAAEQVCDRYYYFATTLRNDRP
jgi:hypothetical protein